VTKLAAAQTERLQAILAQDLLDDQADYRQLQALLVQLHQALLARECPRIDEINPRIETLTQQLEPRTQRRVKALRALGLGGDAKAMPLLLARLPQGQRQSLQKLWAELGELAAACAAQNERNGQLLAMQHELLDQLIRQASAEPLYGPSSHAY
jgi:flagellar biosynthesis protein FlgN